MISFSSTMLSAAGRVFLLLALVAFVAEVDAKGRGGRSSSGAGASKKSDSESSGTTIRLRGPTSSQSTGGAMPATATAADSAEPAPPPIDFNRPETLSTAEAARRAALMDASEREQAEQAAARKAVADRAEVDRIAASKAAAARKAAAESAAAAEVESVLQRAKGDYPVLNTAQGEPVLASIKERQKELAATGMYPSVAMVQAVARHEHLLRRPEARASFAVAPPAQAGSQPAAEEDATSIGNCRWVTPLVWSCK
ncbi:hypothetical protein [Ramlibacter sp. WS9]|uniref:hypothetical protein n=1 Tax=Ramlibacter sp. WS9 TaxID=1882741 RepID=UPI001169ACBE|nr:hypothetical protein [Ramlibacter sp. WS9]ROZ74315.1 hypothetical protein EEB15_17345 [Ramlibacter sp. WS9]